MGDKNLQALTGQTLDHNADKMPVSYVVEELLSDSSVVDTYLASHKGVNLKVGLKVLAPSLCAQPGFQARFQESIRTQLKLNSPNLLKLYDYGNTNEYFYVVCEHHKSATLRRRLEGEEQFELPVIAEVIRSLAIALEYAAKLGIYHGILSPQSITISRTRGALLADFGLAQVIGPRLPKALSEDIYLTSYAAPEVLRGEAISSLSDQYSLTALLFHLLTGRPPFGGIAAHDLFAAHATAPVPNPSADNADLARFDEIIQRGLAKEPGARFASVDAFNAALTAAMQASLSSAADVEQPAPVPDPEPVVPIAVAPPDAAPVSPPTPTPEPDVMAMDRTMPEMSIADIQRAAQADADAAAEALPAAPAPEPDAMAMDRTMPEMSIADIQRAAQADADAAAALPAAPAPEPDVMAMDRTMPEMSIADIQRAAQADADAAAALPIPEPAPTPEPDAMAMDRTMPEMSIADIRRAAEAEAAAAAPLPEPEPEPVEPEAAVQLQPEAQGPTPVPVVEEVYYDAPGMGGTLMDIVIPEEGLEAAEEDDSLRRPSGPLLPEDLPEPKDKRAKTKPSGSTAAQPIVSVPASPPPQSVPTLPPAPYGVQPVAEPAGSVPPAPYVPHKQPAPAPQPIPAAPPIQAAPPAAAPRLDATMQEMPAAAFQPPPAAQPTIQPAARGGKPPLDATMQEMAAAPPAYPGSQQSVPYNFSSQPPNNYPGAQQTPPQDLEERYKTNWMRRSDLRRRSITDEAPAGLTGMMKAPVVASDGSPNKRSRTLLWVILVIILLGIAATIGFMVLRALGVFAV